MSALHGTFNDVARSLGISPARLQASRLDVGQNPGGVVNTIAGTLERLDQRHGDGKSRRDGKWRRDAASAFVTSALSQVLTPSSASVESGTCSCPAGPGINPHCCP